MRTTITIEPDVEKRLREEIHRTRRSFKAVVNDAIRNGLRSGGVAEPSEPYRVQSKPLGVLPGLDPLKLQQSLDELDAEDFQKTLHDNVRDIPNL